MADIFQDYVSSFSALRTGQVLTIIFTILTTLGTFFLNTIYKLHILAGAKLMADVAVLAFLKHYPLSFITDIFKDDSSNQPLISIGDGFLGSRPLLSIGDGGLSRIPFINIEEANIHYSSSGMEFLPQRVDYGGRFQLDTDYVEEEEPVHVYREGEKRRSDDLSVWDY
jgi:hypothetical protein